MKHVKLFEEWSTLNELFGLSQKDKDVKKVKDLVSDAKMELSKFDFNKLIRTRGQRGFDDVHYPTEIGHILKDISYHFNALKKLSPKLFEWDRAIIRNADSKKSQLMPGQWYEIIFTKEERQKMYGGDEIQIDKAKAVKAFDTYLDDKLKWFKLDYKPTERNKYEVLK